MRTNAWLTDPAERRLYAAWRLRTRFFDRFLDVAQRAAEDGAVSPRDVAAFRDGLVTLAKIDREIVAKLEAMPTVANRMSLDLQSWDGRIQKLAHVADERHVSAE